MGIAGANGFSALGCSLFKQSCAVDAASAQDLTASRVAGNEVSNVIDRSTYNSPAVTDAVVLSYFCGSNGLLVWLCVFVGGLVDSSG